MNVGYLEMLETPMHVIYDDLAMIRLEKDITSKQTGPNNAPPKR